MRTFARYKTVDEIKEAAASRGLTVDTSLHDDGRSDFIRIDGPFGGQPTLLLYSGFNGRFLGTRRDGQKFNSDSPDFDDEPWFGEILDLVYAEQVATA
jgi:hypothetical protein